ncbi:DUF2842 domain-containing protein [Sphingomonas nostoxanthinifaciens]|uniref:DUF2842 domain-containing protein n=1 Tax=Sphingomonas nostoxanthinifaciens TaxID=2872652 RepID=UPI0037DA2DD9
MLLILLLIAIWAGLVVSQSQRIATLPGLLQALVYAVAGIVWITPLKPLLRWMEIGPKRMRNDRP